MSEKIIFDKTEMIITVMENDREVIHNITYDKIKSILIGKKLIKKFFGLYKKITPAILITVVGRNDPLDVTEADEGAELFAKYIEQIKLFAKNNHVTIRESDPNDPPHGAKADWRLS